MVARLGRIRKLPSEIVDMIVDHMADFTLTDLEAKKLRVEFTAERSNFVESVN